MLCIAWSYEMNVSLHIFSVHGWSLISPFALWNWGAQWSRPPEPYQTQFLPAQSALVTLPREKNSESVVQSRVGRGSRRDNVTLLKQFIEASLCNTWKLREDLRILGQILKFRCNERRTRGTRSLWLPQVYIGLANYLFKKIVLTGRPVAALDDEMNPWQKWNESSRWIDPPWRQNCRDLDHGCHFPICMNFIPHSMCLICPLSFPFPFLFTTPFRSLLLPPLLLLFLSSRGSDWLNDFHYRQLDDKILFPPGWLKKIYIPYPTKLYSILHLTFISTIFFYV